MKKIFLGLTLLSFVCVLSAQSSPSKGELNCIKKIQKLTYNWKILDAFEKCNECIEKYPGSGILYLSRADIQFDLNHMEASVADFRKGMEIGAYGVTPELEEFIRWISDTAFIVRALTDSVKFLTLKPELGYKSPYTLADTLRGMLRPERSCFDITYEKLSLRIIPEDRGIEGMNEITFRVVDSTRTIQLDLFRNFEISGITGGGMNLEFRRIEDAIFIDLDTLLLEGQDFTLSVSYSGIPREAPNPPWDGGFIWKEKDNRYEVGVACEHLGASSWWPTKDHLSDKPDSMDICIQAPAGYDVVSNGNLVGKEVLPGGTVNHRWHVSYPINSYNVTFYMGDYVNFSEKYLNTSGDSVDVDYYVHAEHLDSAMNFYARTISILKTFEELYGDYTFPDDGVGYVESPYAGMEHQGAIAIGDVYENDSAYEVYQGVPFLVVHETAHEWWGNAVAVGDMADIWISEGFATYSEHLLWEKIFGHEKYIEEVANNMFEIMNIWPMVGNRNVNDDAFMGGDVYNKGAAMLHNLRCILNDDQAFFTMIRDFYQKSCMKIVNSEDFIKHAQHYSTRSLDDFFDVFMHHKSPPLLEYSFVHQSGGKTLLNYRWTGVGAGFEMPFLIIVNDGIGLRMECSTSWQSVVLNKKVKNYYLATPVTMSPWIADQNAFTYYTARWVEP